MTNTIVINLISMTINNLILSYPLYVIPDYRISRKKFFVIYALWGTLFGNIKYFCQQDSIMELVMTVANSVTLLLILAFTLKGNFYKFVIAFGLFGMASFSTQILSVAIGVKPDADVYDIELTYIAFVHTFGGILIYSIVFGIKNLLNKKTMRANLDVKSIICIYLMVYYTLISQMYSNRAIDDIMSMPNAFVDGFGLVVLAAFVGRAIIVSSRNLIKEYDKAREREKSKLEQLFKQNEYIAKLRHDYINEINIVEELAKKEPQKAMEILDKMEAQYRNVSCNM